MWKCVVLITAVCPNHPEWPLHQWQLASDLAPDSPCPKRLWQKKCGHDKVFTHVRRGPRGRLVVQPMHGLMNRVRAMVSAKLVAQYSDRDLVVVWTRDIHCNASYASLFEHDADVSVVDTRGHCDSTWTLVGSNDHNAVVKTKSIMAKKTLCIVTAYKVIADVFSPYVSKDVYADALKRWRPSTAVQSIIASFNLPKEFVALHIRSVSSITQDVPDIEHSSSGTIGIGAMDVDVLKTHRESCVWQSFLPAIQRLAPLGMPFVVASDSTDAGNNLRAQLVAATHGGLRSLKQPSACFGAAARTETCQQYALATVAALMTANKFVGSTWSSYSEAIADVVGDATTGCRSKMALPARQPANRDKGMAVIVACRNRDTAYSVVQTVLAAAVDQVVVVDWAMSTMTSTVVPKDDARVTVITAINESQWHLGRAYNLAMRFVTAKIVWKIDCDTKVNSAAVKAAANLEDGVFKTGAWQNGGNAAHLNGNIVVKTADFWAVGGYDERIQSYGWDDDALYNRLNASGLTWSRIEPSWATHIEHSDAKRASVNLDASIQRNRLCEAAAPPWKTTEPSQYDIISQVSTAPKGTYANGNAKGTNEVKSATVVATYVPAEICTETSADLTVVDAIVLWTAIKGNTACSKRFWDAVGRHPIQTDTDRIAVIDDAAGAGTATQAATECVRGNKQACTIVARLCERSPS